jgi:GTP-binding protein
VLFRSEIPGTTRDSVDISFSMGGKDYVFIDTAGIRRKAKVKEKVEKFSVGKTLESLRRCDIAVIILDASEGATEQDARICNYAMEQGKGTVITVNKWDLVQGKRDLVKRLKESISLQLRFISFAPSLYLSAMTGKGVKRLFPVLDKLYGEISTRLPTSTVNSVIEAAFAENPPPRAGKRQLKISYATQAAIRPPTFVLFVNNAELMPDSYERYLVNRLRAELKLFHSPIKIVAREKGKKYTRSQGGQK